MVVLGMIVCGGATYVISKQIPPVYQASAILIINLESSTSAYDNVSGSQLAATTYASLLTNPEVLKPVLAQHPQLTLKQLSDMVTAKVQPNTSLIELDVNNSDPGLAAQLANEIAQRFAFYAKIHLFPVSTKTQLVDSVVIVPAQTPVDPIRPKPLTYAGIGALVGLGLALSLIVIFEWMDDRLAGPEEVQKLLGMEILTVIPFLSRKQRIKNIEEVPVAAEGYRTLSASLNAAQAIKPFKLVMVTSALPDEGKSTVAVNLASFLAMASKRVLLVEANLRHPGLDQHFQFDQHQGLSWVQLEAVPNGEETDAPALRVLTAGVPHSNPAELLQSPLTNQHFDYFKKAAFDYIIFDTPPLLPVVDAQILASHIQAAVLVVDASKTPRRTLRCARHVLSRTRAMTLGVVLNKSRWPDCTDRRHYLSKIRQPGTAVTMTVPPNTPPVDEAVDQDITVTISSRQQQEMKDMEG